MTRRVASVGVRWSAAAFAVFTIAGGAHAAARASDAPALEREVRRIAARSAGSHSLWPGFDPLAVPLAVFDGERTWLFRHPSPPSGFAPTGSSRTNAVARTGRHEAVTANSNAVIAGRGTATVLLEGGTRERPLEEVAAMAIHEAFHVFQSARHPGWTGDEVVLFTYPVTDAELLALRRLEFESLRRALAARTPRESSCRARAALAYRRERFARMDSASAAYERGTELNEGLAAYVEHRAARRRRLAMRGGEFAPAQVRHRAYETGTALALLLDRVRPAWRADFERDDRQVLDGALEVALGPGERCESDAEVVAAERTRAAADVRALDSLRSVRRAAFERAPGWRVEFDARGEPFWPQGFDPLNVERLGGASVLHGRYVKLGNGAGQLETYGAAAITEGAGAHPLFEGVRRVVLSGLGEPDASEADGAVTIRARGLTAEFRGARLERDGTTLRVRVGD